MATIAEMYQQSLGRSGAADAAGINYWQGQINSGAMNEAQVAQAIASSPEAQAYQSANAPQTAAQSYQNIGVSNPNASSPEPIYTDESVRNMVEYMYATELGRAGDEAGINYWINNIQSGALPETEFRNTFLDAARGAGETTLADVKGIKEIYLAGFGEEPTQEEIDYWTGELNSGNLNPSNITQAITTAADADNREFDKAAVQQKFSDNYMEKITGYSQDMKPFSYDKDKMMTPGYNPKEQFVFNEDDPSYKFRQEEAMKALERSQAAQGNLLSGGAVKAGQQYASDLASQEYGNQYNRWQGNRLNEFNMGQQALTSDYNRQLTDYNTQQNQLINLANYGVGAQGAVQSAAGAYGGQVGNSLINSGNAQAAGYLGAGQAQAQMYGNVAGAVQQGASNMMLNKYLGQ